MTMLEGAPAELRSKAIEEARSCIYSMNPDLNPKPTTKPNLNPSPSPSSRRARACTRWRGITCPPSSSSQRWVPPLLTPPPSLTTDPDPETNPNPTLAKLGAASTLLDLEVAGDHEAKQCRLNATAALYAVSCGGRAICKDISALKPLSKLRSLVNPGVGRSAQDDQLQLFATLLVVNLLHVKGTASERLERQELLLEMQRAYDDATEQQVRDTI